MVYEAKELSTGELFAIKRIKRKFIKKKLLQREIDIMKNLRHPNILYCKEVFETDQFISIVLELYAHVFLTPHDPFFFLDFPLCL